MAKRNSFKKGTIELLTLAILQDGDCYGYQITQSICDKSNGIITVTEGALYPILYRLVDKGYLTDYKKPGRQTVNAGLLSFRGSWSNIFSRAARRV